jgi:hypothetical protein
MPARRDQLGLPLPLDAGQRSVIDTLVEQGFIVASEGTDRWAFLETLRERDLAYGVFCRHACGIWQWHLTPRGREVAADAA